MEIIPAILVHSHTDYYKQLNTIDHIAPRIHIDIADGTLVPNTTWADPMMVQDATPCDIDLHLMVDNPWKVAETWAEVPQVKRYIVHVEAQRMSMETIKSLTGLKKEVWLAKNPGTPLSVLEPYLSKVAGVLHMSVEPGLQGQPFADSVLEDIKAFRNKHPHKDVMVDGHVDEDTLPQLAAAGAHRFCIGSAIFHRDASPEEQYSRFIDIGNSLT